MHNDHVTRSPSSPASTSSTTPTPSFIARNLERSRARRAAIFDNVPSNGVVAPAPMLSVVGGPNMTPVSRMRANDSGDPQAHIAAMARARDQADARAAGAEEQASKLLMDAEASRRTHAAMSARVVQLEAEAAAATPAARGGHLSEREAAVQIATGDEMHAAAGAASAAWIMQLEARIMQLEAEVLAERAAARQAAEKVESAEMLARQMASRLKSSHEEVQVALDSTRLDSTRLDSSCGQRR